MSRRSQPYRKGMAQPGHALTAMRRGKPAAMPHPPDAKGVFARALSRRRKSRNVR